MDELADALLSLYNSIGENNDTHGVYGHVASLVRLFGYDYYSYERKRSLPLAQAKYVVIDNYPEALRQLYETHRRHWHSAQGSFLPKSIAIVPWSIVIDAAMKRAPGADGRKRLPKAPTEAT